MVQNGPGPEGFIHQPCDFISAGWMSGKLLTIYSLKDYFLRGFGDKSITEVAPYFSKTPYLSLMENLRSLLNGYNFPRNRGENIFPLLEEIYSKYLVFF